MCCLCGVVIGCYCSGGVSRDWLGECLGRIAKTVERGVTRGGDALPSLIGAMTVLNYEVFANCNSGVF